MPEEPTILPCELCGKQATSWTRDCFAETFVCANHIHYRPNGPGHFYCDEHKRDSQTTPIHYLFTKSDGSSGL